ncbi:uncharacterized protein [Nicotiana tomentosiformis]|uniref:uncharacterized protein n=1 Tax=Nicotiana tomentosiformis TaxID=4098 RepID=UPI00388C897B
MANLFENPSSPPKETTLTPSITPSPTPTSKKGRFKMIARKVVVGGEQIKKINEQLKASRAEEPQKFEESFKCATEGEETVSYKIEQVTSSQKITSETISEVAEKLENSLVLVGTMAGVETTESGKLGGKNKKKKEKESEGTQGYVRGMGKGVAKSSPTPVGLTEETRAMVVSSEESAGEEESLREKRGYNPKQKKSLGVKILGTVRANKKRKAASSIPVETPPTRGRDTRSQKKQSEAELEKALEDSKRKVASKGKKKMVEHVEAVEIEEMDLVLRDEDKEEVATPKTKKRKTSKKKSPSKTKSAEPSTLSHQCGEGSDCKLRRQRIERDSGCTSEGYNDYKNLKWPSLENLLTSLAITRKFADNELELEAKAIYKSEMNPPHKVLFEFVNKVMLPRQEKRQIATFIDLVPLKKWDISTSKDHFGANTLTACDYEVHATVKEPGSSKKVPVNSKVRALVQESGAKDAEIERPKKRLVEVETERDDLRAELAKEKEKNEGILHDMLKLLQAKNQEPSPSQP